MNGKENIINKILADADARCEELLAQATRQAQTVLDKANAAIASEKSALNAKIEESSALRLRNGIASAELDAKKYRLNAKQRLISECYAKAYDSFKNMSAQDKAAFLSGLLCKFAEKGEKVTAAKADKDIVTQKFLDGLGKNLTLNKTYHNGDGGVILEGVGYEKDLTLPRVVAYLREQTESKVAAALFGE